MDYSEILRISLDEIRKKITPSLNVIADKIRKKTATFDDALIFSKSVGNAIAEKVKGIATDDDLAEFAEEYLSKIYKSGEDSVIYATMKVAKVVNERDMLTIGVVDPDYSSRIANIIQRFKEASNLDDVSFLFGDDVIENLSKSAVVRTVKANAEFRKRIGVETYVSRQDNANCCEWCASMVGVYPIEEIPEDFWRVHKRCTCSFEYRKNNQFTKITYTTRGNRMIKNTENIVEI